MLSYNEDVVDSGDEGHGDIYDDKKKKKTRMMTHMKMINHNQSWQEQ